MERIRHISRLLGALALVWFATPPFAGPGDDVIRAEIRPGWTLADGSQIAALHLALAAGWKTYWRAPGEGGIPPEFSWRGSRNLSGVAITWPTPEVFDQGGLRTMGYRDEVLIPLRLTRETIGAGMRLKGRVDLGVCKDICMPHTIEFDAQLPVERTTPDPAIAAALASVPLSAAEGNVSAVTCRIEPVGDGLRLRAQITMPSAGAPEIGVIETSDPRIWVARTQSSRAGNVLTLESELAHMSGGAFAFDRSAVRFTVLGSRYAVDIRGCS